jgi:hypothetical protein
MVRPAGAAGLLLPAASVETEYGVLLLPLSMFSAVGAVNAAAACV